MRKTHPVAVASAPLPACSPEHGVPDGDLAVEHSIKSAWISVDTILNSASGICETLGELLLQAKRITPEQRDFSLAEQKRTGEKIGELLVRLGWLTSSELAAVLALQQNRDGSEGSLLLGNILLAMGVVSRGQLENAIALQRTRSRRLGDVLVEEGYARPHDVVRGLNLQRRLRKTAVIALLSFVALAGAAPVAVAESHSNMLTVSAFVMPNTKLNVLSQTAQLTITAANIERGYIDVPAASRIEVRSNSRDGFALVFDPMPNLFEAIQITGLGAPVELGTEGGTVVQRRDAQQSVSLQLGYRFIFSKNVRPGNYAWPIALSARAL